MYDDPCEKELRIKYENHDFAIADFSNQDADLVRMNAIRDISETKESDNVKVIVNSFLGFLTSKGFRIVKKEIK